MNFAKFLLGLALTSLLFSKEYLAVIDFGGHGTSQSEANALTQRLISSLIKFDEYKIIERSEMKALLDEQKFQYSGCSSTQCAVDIGRLIGAKYMVVGTIGLIGSTYAVDARVIDVETGEAISSASYSHSGAIDRLLLEGIEKIAAELFNKEYISTPSIKEDVKKDSKKSAFSYFTTVASNILWPMVQFPDSDDALNYPDFPPYNPMNGVHVRLRKYDFIQFKFQEKVKIVNNLLSRNNPDAYGVIERYMAIGYFHPFNKGSKLSYSSNLWFYLSAVPDIPSYLQFSIQAETSKFLSFGIRPELGFNIDFDGNVSYDLALYFIFLSFGDNY